MTGPLQLFTNNAISILDQNLSPTDTVIQLAQNYGPLFPIPQNPGEFFLVTLETTTAPFHREIVKIDHRVDIPAVVPVAAPAPVMPAPSMEAAPALTTPAKRLSILKSLEPEKKVEKKADTPAPSAPIKESAPESSLFSLKKVRILFK